MSESTIQPEGATKRPLLTSFLILGTGVWFLVALIVASLLISRVFQVHLTPPIEQNIAVIGETIAADVHRAVSFGIPFGELRGMPEYLESILETHQDLDYVAVSNAAGQYLYSAGSVIDYSEAGALDVIDNEVAIFLDGARLGAIHVGVAREVAFAPLSDLIYDVGSVLVVAMVGTFEVLLAILAVSVLTPLRELRASFQQAALRNYTLQLAIRSRNEYGRIASLYNRITSRLRKTEGGAGLESSPALGNGIGARDISLVRIVLVCFVLSEELTRSFLPLYVATLEDLPAQLSEEAAIGLPISVFMVVVGLGTLVSGGIVSRIGFRTAFVLSTVPSTAGFLGILISSDYGAFLLFRCLTAFGYAMGTLSIQAMIAQAPLAKDRLKGMSGFVAAIMTAAILGSAIGGMLAEYFGYQIVFATAATVAALSSLLALSWFTRDSYRDRSSAKQSSTLSSIVLLCSRNWDFTIIILAIIVPTKAVLAGVLYFAIPLHLGELTFSPADIGRVMILYFLTMSLCSSLSPRILSGLDRSWLIVGFGTLLGFSGPILFYLLPNLAGAVGCAVLMALGSGLAGPHAVSIAIEKARDRSGVGSSEAVAALRLFERLGSAIGPAFVAFVASTNGLGMAVGALGLVSAGGACLFIGRSIIYGRSSQ